ncbi:transposase [Desulfovulcanus sp.]
MFVTLGKGKEYLKRFSYHLREQGRKASNIAEVACDMSRSFLNGVQENFVNAATTC